MEQVLKLAEGYIVQRIMNNHAPLSHAKTVGAGLVIFVAFMVLLGGCMSLAGFYMWLETIMPTYMALAVMGGVLIAISIFMVLVYAFFQRIKLRKMQQARDKVVEDVRAGIKLLDYELSEIELIRQNPKSVAFLSVILGYLIVNKVDL